MKLPVPYLRNAERARTARIALKFATIPLVVIPLFLLLNTQVQWRAPTTSKLHSGFNVLLSSKRVEGRGRSCDIFKGKWVPNDGGTYYTNSTCSLIIDQVNCFKFGRPDSEFLKWRWKPDGCVLPMFDARSFLELVRGKSMAFVGDSLGRNQMNSLQCLLSSVESPQDLTEKYKNDPYFPRWYFPKHNFTVAAFWAPFLVTAVDPDPSGHFPSNMTNIRLDEPEDSWVSEIENFDFVILSAGIWLYHPSVFYKKGRVVGCNTDSCRGHNTTNLGVWYGFRMAFRTTFDTILRKKDYQGITFLRTFSPSHFENGQWNSGGTCTRTEPLASIEEARSMPGQHHMNAYLTPIEEFKAAEKVAAKRELKLKLLYTTDAMLLRADAHPNFYGDPSRRNTSVADCVHWCLPGPIDTWNEFLQYHLMSM